MSRSEAQDRERAALYQESVDLAYAFHTALDHLRTAADDFGEGSQQRWLTILRNARELHDERWRLDQRIATFEAER